MYAYRYLLAVSAIALSYTVALYACKCLLAVYVLVKFHTTSSVSGTVRIHVSVADMFLHRLKRKNCTVDKNTYCLIISRRN